MSKPLLSFKSDSFTIHLAPAFTFTHAGEKYAIYLRGDDAPIERVSELLGEGEAEVDQSAFTELNLLADVRPTSELRPVTRIGFL